MQKQPERDFAFGRGIARLMEQHDISKQLLADFAECSQPTVRLTTQGITVPKPETAARMAAVFRMTVEEVEALGRQKDADTKSCENCGAARDALCHQCRIEALTGGQDKLLWTPKEAQHEADRDG